MKNKRELIIIVLSIIALISVIIDCKIMDKTRAETYVQNIEWSDNNTENDTTETIILSPDDILSEDTSVPVTDSQQDFYKISDEDIYLLAKIVQCEAGNQDIYTKEYVVLVILNRVESDKFPDTIEEVIKENHNGVYQFTPVIPGNSWYYTEPNEESYNAVYNVLDSDYDYSNGALFFESCSNPDNWHSRNLEFLFSSCDMRFYR